MKRTIALLLALVTIVALAGCGVASRNYRRINTPAADYNLGARDGYIRDRYARDGVVHDGSRMPRSRDGGYVHRPRHHTDGAARPDGAGMVGRSRGLNPGGMMPHVPMPLPMQTPAQVTPATDRMTRSAQTNDENTQNRANEGTSQDGKKRSGATHKAHEHKTHGHKARTHKAS